MKNNNEQFENFIRDFDKIRMTNTEKESIAQNIELFARSYVPQASPYQHYISLFKKTTAAALILLLMFSVSKPASAKALPGEFLYKIKIIHEEIEEAQIKEPKKKINFEIKRTARRIHEAVELAETNKLDTDIQKEIAHSIKKHVETISKKIEKIKEENPEQALALNSDLKTTLKINSQALQKVTEIKEEAKTQQENIGEEKEIYKEKQDEKEKKQIQENNDIFQEKENREKVSKSEVVKNEKDVSENNNENKEDPLKEEKPLDETKSEEIINNDEKILAEKEKQDLQIPETSFADIILDSIDENIQKTEAIDNSIKEEIVKNEENNTIKSNPEDKDSQNKEVQKESVDQPKEETDISKENKVEEIDIKTTEQNGKDNENKSEIQTQIEEIGDKSQNIEIQEESVDPPAEEMSILEEGNNTENTDVLIPPVLPFSTEEKQKELKIKTKEVLKEMQRTVLHDSIAKDVQSKISSLEHILEAEKRLEEILFKLHIQRKIEDIMEVEKLIDEKQFGKAYIHIQN